MAKKFHQIQFKRKQKEKWEEEKRKLICELKKKERKNFFKLKEFNKFLEFRGGKFSQSETRNKIPFVFEGN